MPCPTALLTIGLLLTMRERHAALSVIPLAWALAGGSGALLFGVYADIVLWAAAAALAVDLLTRHAAGNLRGVGKISHAS